MLKYHEIFDTVEEYSIEEHMEISDLIKQRAIEEKRIQLSKEIAEANAEYEAGLIQSKTVEEIMKMVKDEE